MPVHEEEVEARFLWHFCLAEAEAPNWGRPLGQLDLHQGIQMVDRIREEK